jgi:nucleotide-binding universal stress UspA family protein
MAGFNEGTDTMASTDIVVGVDGSGPSLAAVHWAATEAKLRAAPLRILVAHPGTQADEVVAAAVAHARDLALDIDVTGAVVTGDPTHELVAAGRHASLVVVGNRGRGGAGSLLLGSVSQHVATRCPAPVVVVRGAGLDRLSGPIVLGVDGSDPALRAAFEEADLSDSTLVAVRTFAVPPAGHLLDTAVRARDELAIALRPWREKYPSVAVKTLVDPGDPAKTLVRLSTQARLVVVGNRGRGYVAGTLLGSVGLHLLHHAACPVLIVR